MKPRFSRGGFILAGIRRRPGRNLATVLCFVFIAASIFSTQYMMAGTAGSLNQGASRMGADFLVIPSEYAVLIHGTQVIAVTITQGSIIRVEPSTLRIDDTVMTTIGNVPDVAAMSPQLYVATETVPASPSPLDIYGIDPVSDFTVRPWLQAPLKKTLGHNEVIVGDGVAGATGEQIAIGGTTWTIAGRLDQTGSAVDHSIFMTMDDAYALAAVPGVLSPTDLPVRPGSVNAVLVKAEPGADPALVAARVQQPFSLAQIKVLSKHFTLQPVSEAAQGLPAFLMLISLVVVLAAFPLIALISAMVAHERQREIGLLLAMGAKRSFIFLVIMAESMALAAIGGIIGTFAGLAAFFLVNEGWFSTGSLLQGFQAPAPAETAVMAAIAIIAVIGIGSIASLWPAYRSSRMNPYDAIRNAE